MAGSSRPRRVLAPERKRWLLPVVIGVVIVAIIGVIAAVWMSQGEAVPNPTPTVVTSDDPTPDATGPGADPSEGATPSPALPPEPSPYCKAFGDLGLSEQVEGTDDEGQVDFARLALVFKELTDKYSEASKLAPQSLQPEYAKVLKQLRQGLDAVTSQDFEELKKMVKNLNSLNETMEKIYIESTAICG